MTKLQNIIGIVNAFGSIPFGIVVMDMDGRVLVSLNPLAIVVACGISGFAELGNLIFFLPIGEWRSVSVNPVRSL